MGSRFAVSVLPARSRSADPSLEISFEYIQSFLKKGSPLRPQQQPVLLFEPRRLAPPHSLPSALRNFSRLETKNGRQEVEDLYTFAEVELETTGLSVDST